VPNLTSPLHRPAGTNTGQLAFTSYAGLGAAYPASGSSRCSLLQSLLGHIKIHHEL